MNNYYGFNPQMNLNRIDKQIEELNNLKMQMQNPPQQAPINNYINTGMPKIEMEAKILSEGQNVSDTIIQNRTLFVDEANKTISIKEVDGTISKTYEIVVPKTKEQLLIEELENKLKIMEVKYDELNKSNISNKQNKQSNNGNDGNNEPTTKANNEQFKK